MARDSVVTENKLKDYHENLVYPYLNGSTHTGCVPLGTIIPYFGETAPTHFLICDGTAYNKADYPELSQHLLSLTDHSAYEVSGDNTKFKVPDLRGEFLRGKGTNGHSGQGSGSNVGVHQDATEIPTNLIYKESSTSFRLYNYVNNAATTASIIGYNNLDSTKNAENVDQFYRSVTKDSAIQNSATYYTSRPTNTSVMFCIAYKNAYIDLALDSFPINISNPTDGQLLMFDATAGRWVNGGHKYSTTEHVVGTWIDGKPIYEKLINNVVLGNTLIENVSELIDFRCSHTVNSTDTSYILLNGMSVGGVSTTSYQNMEGALYPRVTDNHDFKISLWGGTYIGTINWVVVQYTKTTDTAST